MKRKLLSAAVSALALGGFAQSAQATSYDLYLAGSSAQDSLVMSEVATMCVSGTLSYYVDDNYGSTTASSWGSNYKAYSCTINPSAVSGVSSGDVVTFHKVNFGGSAQGVAPLFQNAAVPTLNINNGNCYQLTTGYTSKVGNTSAGVPTYACRTTSTNDLVAEYLDAGLSDVNPTMFQGVNQTTTYTTNGTPIKTFANVTSVPSGFTVVPATSLLWAVPVSLNLYTALQAAQGLLNYGGSYGSGSCTAGQYSIDPTSARDGACMPSLNKSQISSVLSGAVADWGTFYFNGVNLATAAADYDAHRGSAAAATPNSNTLVNFCQRTAGSGTAASQYAYFLNLPANQHVSQPLPNAGLTYGTNYSVADGGNMENCLIDMATGSANATDYTGTPVNGTAGDTATAGYTAWAIGQQSSDKNASATKAYRFIKIGGVAPTLANAFSGAYDFTNESSWQYATATPSGRSVQRAIVLQLIQNCTNPASLYTTLNQYSVQQFGAAGFMGTVTNAVALNSSYTVPTAVSLTYPVNPWTHSVSGVLDNGMFQILNPLDTTVTP